MRTRTDDRRNTTRSASAAARGRPRGAPLVRSYLRPVARGRGTYERRTVPGLVRPPVGRGRGRPPSRPRGRPRGRGRGRGTADLSGEDGDEPSDEEAEEEEEDIVAVMDDDDIVAVEEDGEYDEEAADLQPSPVSPRRRLAAGSSAESDTEPDGESGDELVDVLAGSELDRASRRRQLPARFRDAPPPPPGRWRTVSSGSSRGDRPPGSPRKEVVVQRPAPDRPPVKEEDGSPERSPPSIIDLLEEQAEEVKTETEPERPASPRREEPLVIESLESLTDVIELDHGMHYAPPPPAASPRKRQRLHSRSGDAAESRQTLAAAALYHEQLAGTPQHQAGEVQLVSGEMVDEHDLIRMELDPMEVPLPVQTVPRRPCKVCHKQFKVTNMKQHMLTHTGMRPFKCELCPAVFTRRSDVFRHVKIRHRQEKPFKCVKDGKEFSDRKTLKAHMERHKRPSLFACKVCDFRFGKFEYYVNHLKFIHPTGEPLPAFPEDVEPEPEPVAPPRGRYGPTPLQDFIDDDDEDSQGATENVMGEPLQLGGGLESIETEEIPHEPMHLVPAGAAVGGTAAATLLPDSAVPDVVEGQDVVISSAAPAVEPGVEPRPDRPEEPPQEQINFPPLEEDAAAILGMTDLALTNENTSLGAASPAEQQPILIESPGSAPVVVLTGGMPVRRFVDPLISPRSHPRVVTIGKPVLPAGSGGSGAASGPKTVLLTRPRMVAGKQVLQAVKVGAGQKIVSARGVPASRGGGRQPIVRQVLINRPAGAPPRPAPRVVTTRVVRPATRGLPVIGTRTLASAVGGSLKTVSPAVRVVRPAAPVAPPAPPPPPPEQAAPAPEPEPPQTAPVATVATEATGDDTKNIEVTTSTASGSRTIILQTSGGGGDILQSEEAMQTLLEAVQQLVSASGDTLEGKQIEIVMQNDGAGQGGAAAAEAAGAAVTQ